MQVKCKERFKTTAVCIPITEENLIIGVMVSAIFTLGVFITHNMIVASADNFTDIFYTNSFRGAFAWFKNLDWVGMIAQAILSVSCLIGAILIMLRITMSFLFLSARAFWEEVNELKEGGGSGGDGAMYDLGLLSRVKACAQGQHGTGLDAILSAVLILLPNVRRYSDFGEKSGTQFEADISVAQYFLKILLPTVLSLFFLAMGFNGTLWHAFGVTVDAMGTVADRAVSINYAGYIDDLVNSNTGYKFTYASDGTNKGILQDSVAKDVYGKAVSQVSNPNAAQLEDIGMKVVEKVNTLTATTVADSSQISSKVKTGLQAGDASSDKYFSFLGCETIVNTTQEAPGAILNIGVADLMGDGLQQAAGGTPKFIHVYIKQVSDFDGSYFNVDTAK